MPAKDCYRKQNYIDYNQILLKLTVQVPYSTKIREMSQPAKQPLPLSTNVYFNSSVTY